MPFYTNIPSEENKKNQKEKPVYSTELKPSVPVDTNISEPSKSYGFLSNTLPTSAPEPQTVYKGLGYNYNVADFRNNKEVQEAWERFHKSAELNNYDNDVVEYLRDSDYSLGSVVVRSQQIKNWDKQTRKDYTTLSRAFQKADGFGNAKERFKFARNLASDILFDPFNWLTVAAAVPTMGGSLTANAAAQAALRIGLNKGVKSLLTKEALKNTGSIALYGSAEGMAWGGAYEYFSQAADKNIGMQQGPTDWKKVGQVAAMGGAFGAVIPGAIGGISNSLYLRKLYNFSNEDNIYHQASRLAIDSEKVIDVQMSDPSTKIVFFKNQKGSKGRQKKGVQLEIIPLTLQNYKQYILPQAKALGKETFEQVNSFKKFLNYNKVNKDNAFLVIRHGKNKAGRITKQVEPMKELNGSLSASSKEYLEEYFNQVKRRQYWKQVRSFRNKEARKHTQTDHQSAEGLLYARQAGISEKEIGKLAAKYGINIEDVDAAGYKQFKEMVQDHANLDATDLKLTLLHKLISQTVGKATTKYLKLANNNDALVEYLESLVPGATNKLFKKRKSGTSEFVYAENKSNSDGFYLTYLDIALNPTRKTGLGAMLDPEDNNHIIALIMSGGKATTWEGKKISQVAKTAYFGDKKNNLGIKKLLKHAFDAGDESGLFAYTGQVKNYFPQKLQYSKIASDRTAFEDILIKAGHADPINELKPTKFYNSKGDLIEGFDVKAMPKDKELWGRDFLSEAGENLDKARQLKAAAIVDDMLEKRWTPFVDDSFIPSTVKGGHGFMKHRVFDKVPHVEMLPYIETDVRKVLTDYLVNFSQANVRTQMYGRNINAMYRPASKGKQAGIFKRVQDEFLAKGGDRGQVAAIMKKLEEMHRLVTGLDHNSIQNNVIRTVSDWGKLSQQMAHLPLAVVTSITEPLILLSRARASDGINVAFDIAHAMKKQTARTVDRMAQQTKRAQGKTTRGLKEFDDEEWIEIYKTGLALEQATMERIEGLAGEALSGGLAKNVQTAFFKTNFLTQWTAAVQLAAFTTGKRLIKQNAESLYLHNAGIKKLGKKKVQYLSGQLEELGIPLDQANAWYKKYLNKDGVFNVAKANKDNFYTQRIVRGANRFTREIILNPSISSANRPLWFSHPAGQLLMQFAGYPTVFTNTVLKRFINEAGQYPLQTTPKMLATTMLMTSVAMMGNYIRTGGKNWEEQEPGELISHALRRWGGFGFYEYADKVDKNLKYSRSVPAALLKIGGPLPADIVDMLLYQKGFAQVGAENLPGYSALPKETRDYLKKAGRDADKFLYNTFLAEDTKRPFARGGIVDVPNAKDEPDEMINKLTGLPYNATSTSVQDIEDRERRAEGSDGAESVGGPLSRLSDTFKSKIPLHVRVYMDKVIFKNKADITEKDFTEAEYKNLINFIRPSVQKNIRSLEINEDNKFVNKSPSVFGDEDPILYFHHATPDFMENYIPFDKNLNEGSLYYTFGDATYELNAKPYEKATLKVKDLYDFNFRFAGNADGTLEEGEGPGFNKENIKKYTQLLISESAGRDKFKNRDDYNAVMGVAERYGAMTIPDQQAAAELNKEHNPIKTNVTIPVSKIFSANEWSNILQGKTSDEEIGYQGFRIDSERKGFESGGTSGPPKFETRIARPDPKMFIPDSKGNPQTHRMAWGNIEGQFIAYPTIVEQDGKLVQYENNTDTMKLMKKTGNFKAFDTKEEAEAYADGGWKTKKFNETYRKGFESGGVSGIMKRLIERGGEAMGVGKKEQRANEKQTAFIINNLVAEGRLPQHEYIKVDNANFPLQEGPKSNVFEAVNHGLLSATYGDYMVQRGALQLKEFGQGATGRPQDSKRDFYNNKVGFNIIKTANTPEEITQELNNRIIKSYEKWNSGEDLIFGEDFFKIE